MARRGRGHADDGDDRAPRTSSGDPDAPPLWVKVAGGMTFAVLVLLGLLLLFGGGRHGPGQHDPARHGPSGGAGVETSPVPRGAHVDGHAPPGGGHR